MSADKFLRMMGKQIHNKQMRQEIMRECGDHIRDCKEALMEMGMTDQEAEEEAVRQMGDPVESGRTMGRLYRTVLDLNMLTFFWGMGVLVNFVAFGLYRIFARGGEQYLLFQDIPISAWNAVGSIFILIGFFGQEWKSGWIWIRSMHGGVTGMEGES